jgi:glycosyltransferase involved in cell wall biosynthesis
LNSYLTVIPAYNEEQSILEVINSIRTHMPSIDILVINDGSTDKTSEIARSANVFVIDLPYNIGYGGAIQTGFRFAVEYNYEYVITIDADGQHEPSSIKNLIDAMEKENADVVIGSRFIDGDYKMPFFRKLGSRIFSIIAILYTGTKFTDPTSGFQLLNRKAFKHLAEFDNYPLDYPDVNIIMALHKMKFKVVEAPVKMKENIYGKSIHSGLKPIIYVFRMFLAIIMVLLRKEE